MSFEAYQYSLPKYEVIGAYRYNVNIENKQRDSIILALKFVGGHDIKIEDYYVVCKSNNEKNYKNIRDAVGVRLVLLNAADSDMANELKGVCKLKDSDIGICRFNEKHAIKILAYTLEYRVIVSEPSYNQLIKDINNSNLPTLVDVRCDEVNNTHQLAKGAVHSVDFLSITTQYFSKLDVIKAQAANFYSYSKNGVLIGFGLMLIIFAFIQYMN
jgi:hypothetical protein